MTSTFDTECDPDGPELSLITSPPRPRRNPGEKTRMLSPRVNTGWERGRDAGPLTRLDEARAERTESGDRGRVHGKFSRDDRDGRRGHLRQGLDRDGYLNGARDVARGRGGGHDLRDGSTTGRRRVVLWRLGCVGRAHAVNEDNRQQRESCRGRRGRAKDASARCAHDQLPASCVGLGQWKRVPRLQR